MGAHSLSLPLRGIIPPVVTPLKSADSLDVDSLVHLLEHMIAGGVHGLFLLGTTGEGPALSYRLRRQVIAESCRIVRGRIPVLVAITDTSIEESISLGEWAVECGADALVAAAPYYFSVSQNDLFHMVAALTARLPLPFFLYNMPSLTKASFEPETVRRCSELPRVAGIKDSSGDLSYVQALCETFRERPEFSVLVGPEELLSQVVLMGAHGGVNGGANLFPRLFTRLYDALMAGHATTAEDLQAAVLRLGELLYQVGERESSYLRGLKLGLELLDICPSRMAPPFTAANPEEYAELREKLKPFRFF